MAAGWAALGAGLTAAADLPKRIWEAREYEKREAERAEDRKLAQELAQIQLRTARQAEEDLKWKRPAEQFNTLNPIAKALTGTPDSPALRQAYPGIEQFIEPAAVGLALDPQWGRTPDGGVMSDATGMVPGASVTDTEATVFGKLTPEEQKQQTDRLGLPSAAQAYNDRLDQQERDTAQQDEQIKVQWANAKAAQIAAQGQVDYRTWMIADSKAKAVATAWKVAQQQLNNSTEQAEKNAFTNILAGKASRQELDSASNYAQAYYDLQRTVNPLLPEVNFSQMDVVNGIRGARASGGAAATFVR